MKRSATRLSTLLVFGALSALPASVRAQTPTTLTISVDQPQTPVTDVLASLSRQSGVPILWDSTVVDMVGAMHLSEASVPAILSALNESAPGLTWRAVYLPRRVPLPTGDQLSAQVLTLQSLALSGLQVADPSARSTILFSKQSRADAPAPAGTRLVYLVTDETLRAERAADQSRDAAAAQIPQRLSVADLTAAADLFSHMTPDQQRQAAPQLAQQLSRLLKSADPTVRRQVSRALGTGGGHRRA